MAFDESASFSETDCMGGRGGGIVFGSAAVGLECGGDGVDWTEAYSFVEFVCGGNGGFGNVR